METQSIVINNVNPNLLRSTVTAVMSQHDEDPVEGHRTRPGLSPRQAAEDLIRKAAHVSRACVIQDENGAILTVRYRPESPATEPWEGVAFTGHPDDTCYRAAYWALFKDEDRTPPDATMPLAQPPHGGPKDPRPTGDGWAVTIWFRSQDDTVANATRLVVQHYEDYLNPDLPNYRNQRCIVRTAEPGE